jgi:DnaJ-class molecular chaperone
MGHASEVLKGQCGDLLLKIKINEHDMFKREGDNVVSCVALSL